MRLDSVIMAKKGGRVCKGLNWAEIVPFKNWEHAGLVEQISFNWNAFANINTTTRFRFCVCCSAVKIFPGCAAFFLKNAVLSVIPLPYWQRKTHKTTSCAQKTMECRSQKMCLSLYLFFSWRRHSSRCDATSSLCGWVCTFCYRRRGGIRCQNGNKTILLVD